MRVFAHNINKDGLECSHFARIYENQYMLIST